MDFNKLRTYILEQTFEIRIINKSINIVNYESIGHFDSNKIIVRHSDGSVIINGNNLVISKLLKDEVLITGKIKKLELRELHEK